MNGDRLKVTDGASCQKVRLGGPARAGDDLNTKGGWIVEHIRKGVKIGEYLVPNGITDQAKNSLLNTYFNGLTAHTFHYAGLIDATTPTLAATDTYDGIGDTNGWDEFTDYTDGNNSDSAVTRPLWDPGDSTTKQVINSSVMIFNITAMGSVHGLFIVGGPNSQTKGDGTASTNILWSTAPFTGGDVNVENTDQLKCTYYVNA